MIATKKCTLCGDNKSLEAFYKDSKTKDKKTSRCKMCKNLDVAEYRARPSSLLRQSSYDKERRSRPGYYGRKAYLKRVWNIQHEYGSTEQEIRNMMDEQKGCCSICGCSLTVPEAVNGGKYWGNYSIDHCHETMKVRGLLCAMCNRGLGQLGDTLQGVTAAYYYMRRFYNE